MKKRVTLTIDPEVLSRARGLAHSRHMSVSALIEGLVRRASTAEEGARPSFAEKWAGRFRVRRSSARDARLDALRARYGLDEP